VKCYEVTLIIEGGEITFKVQADDEDQAIDHAWNSIEEIPNLVDWRLESDEGLHVVKEVT